MSSSLQSTSKHPLLTVTYSSSSTHTTSTPFTFALESLQFGRWSESAKKLAHRHYVYNDVRYDISMMEARTSPSPPLPFPSCSCCPSPGPGTPRCHLDRYFFSILQCQPMSSQQASHCSVITPRFSSFSTDVCTRQTENTGAISESTKQLSSDNGVIEIVDYHIHAINMP